MSGVYAVGSGSRWDDRRNTSETRGPSPMALSECLQVCAGLRRADPRLVKWIEDGHPNLTHDEHFRRFGVPYKGVRAKR